MDEGATTTINNQAVGVHKKADGSEEYLSLRCPHMGCTVGWNANDKTWDCPCHGSRFATDGKVIHGPAQRDLQTVTPLPTEK